MEIFYVDNKQFDTIVKVYLHLTESKKFYLTGTTSKDFIRIWCKVYLTFEVEREKIESFKIYEIRDNTKLKNAIAIVADHSGSMGEWRAIEVQKAINKLITQKKDNDAFTLVRYNHRIKTIYPPNTIIY